MSNIGTKVKDYMNSAEANSFLFLKVTSLEVEKFRANLVEHGNITKEEHMNLKMVETYLKKFIDNVESRLSQKQNNFFKKKMGRFEIKVLDEYTLKRLAKQVNEQLQTVTMPREDYEDWCNEIMMAKCKDCRLEHSKCDLHDHFLENFVPESGWNLPNCRYASKQKYTLIPKGTKDCGKQTCYICKKLINFNKQDVYLNNYKDKYAHESCAKERVNAIKEAFISK
ncbi:MAG TPA: DUF5651 domain-containing protein [Defluviitaleaceae bacterium]|nr:DUF5651 domain-containing protein [Defluviitaleaceae bacterium]